MSTSRIQLATSISSRLGAESNLLEFAKGNIELYEPKSKHLYEQYRRFLHDILCLGMIESSYYSGDCFQLGKIGLKSLDPKLNDKTPDLYTLTQRDLNICEVTFSFDPEYARREKQNKYTRLFEFIGNNGYNVKYDIVVIDLTDSEWFDMMPKIPSEYGTMINRFVENLLIFHSTIKGNKLRKLEVEDGDLRFPFKYDSESMLKRIFTTIGVSEPELYINKYSDITKKTMAEDETTRQYITDISNAILRMKTPNRPFPHLAPSKCDDLKDEFKKVFSERRNTTKIPVIFQLGSPKSNYEIQTPSRSQIYDDMSSTKKYGGYLDHIKNYLSGTSDRPQDGIIKLSLTTAEFEVEMMAGPGRKRYIKSKNIEIKRSAPKHLGVDPSHSILINDLQQDIKSMDSKSMLLSSQVPSVKVSGISLNKIIDDTFDMFDADPSSYILKFYQRASIEIILNSMKRRRSHEYVLCSSGFESVYILIGPGPQLRTESNVEFIKIISLNEGLQSPLSREWLPVGDHWESAWLSVDTDRLKHWARAYDRVKLSFLSSCETLVEPDNGLRSSVYSETKHGNLSLMTMVYLEDKCSTSTTIQTTRYLLMKSLGDKKFSGLYSKFPTRISSVLQSHILQRSHHFAVLTSSAPVSQWLKLPKVSRDDSTGEIDETTATVLGKVPRIFTKGGLVPIQYALNEMYWCMLYNKDRQNPTQDAMKILNKILKEEQKLDDELNLRDDVGKINHYFGMHSTQDDINHILSNTPESHYFSFRAVSIAALCQDTHRDNHAPKSSWLTDNKIKSILNKNLSEYATFKASVKEIVEEIDISSLDDIKKVGNRTKCIELIHEMVHVENLQTALNVIMEFSGEKNGNFRTFIQIFKKNQIGGVREILILYIKARVLINVLEELSRLMAKADKREILTKGKDKRLMMRGDYEELVSFFPEGTPLMMVKNSYDMSTWCQKFIPTIFLAVHNFHSEALGANLRDFCEFVLLNHCEKKIEYPRNLVKQWSAHPEIKHKERYTQIKKEKFLKDHKPYFINKSNMGQGILHYGSTTLALLCQSLRDRLFEECLQILGKTKSIHWKTRVGSDDKGDLIVLDLTKPDSHFQARLFEQCAEASERLHSMENSVKSASGTILYELNSAFMSNIEVLSPIIKFASAAVDMIATDSCTRFINESYSRIRQLRENGGTSYTCAVAHSINKGHFESIFRTGEGMINDPRVAFNLPEECIPYDMGIYPMYDVDVQDMIGPEYHNYLVFNNKLTPNKMLTMLYSSSINGTSLLPEEDDVMYKKKIMSISRGLVKQLENMKSRLSLDRTSIEKFLEENPFMIIRGPSDIKETGMIIAAKLYTNGAAESLRRTSPAIYLGRLTAFETANAWRLKTTKTVTLHNIKGEEIIENEETLIKCTYREFVQKSYENSLDRDMRGFSNIIFPQKTSFDVCQSFVGRFGLSKEVRKRFAQAIRTWTLNNYNYTFSNSLRQILETSFGLSNEASSDDVAEIKKVIPFDLSTYEDFISSCADAAVRPLDAFFYISKFYNNTRLKKAQVFASGPSTVSLNLTLMNIKKYNHQAGLVMDVDVSVNDDLRFKGMNKYQQTEILRFGFNMLLMHKQSHITEEHGLSFLDCISEGGISLRSQLETIVREKKSLSGLDSQTKKMYIFVSSCLLGKRELREKILSWKTLCYTYLKRQKKNYNGEWVGDLSILVSYASECYTFEIISSRVYITYRYIRSMRDFEQSLKSLCNVLEGVDYESMFDHGNCPYYGVYRDRNLKYATQYQRSVNVLRSKQDLNFKYSSVSDLTEFSIEFKENKDSSMTINLVDSSFRKITLSHYPGHYYPVEIRPGYKFLETLFLNGMRMCKVFKNRMWFFDQSLPSMTEQQAVNFILNDVKPDLMVKVEQNTSGMIKGYMDENDDVGEEYFEEELGGFTGNDVVTDFTRDLTTRTFFEIFQDEANNLIRQDNIINWAQDVQDQEDIKISFEDEVETIGEFIRALGENKQRKRRRDFHTITNLNLNLTVINRVLDLFFRGCNIQNERKETIPHYIKHVDDELSRGATNTQVFFLTRLRGYMINRLKFISGREPEQIEEFVGDIDERRFVRLSKLDSFILGNDKIYKETKQMFDNSDSDSDEEEGIY
jgi:hypothetical protein